MTDYLLFNGGTNKESGVFKASLQYPLPEMTDEEAVAYYTGLLEQAVRDGETELTVQYSWNSLKYQAEGNSSAYYGTIEIGLTYLAER